MTENSMVTIAGAVVVGLGTIILIWWLTSRLKHKGARNLARIVLMPLLVAGLALFGLTIARSEASLLPETTPILVPVETTNVEMGTLLQTLNATGSLAASDETVLNFGISAPVTEVLVRAGDVVQAGDVLARVDTTSVDAEIASAELDVVAAQNALNALQAPPTDLEIEQAQLSIDSANASLSSASQTGSNDTDIEVARLNEELAKNSLWQAQLNQAISDSRSRSAGNYATDIQTQTSLQSSENNVTNAALSYQETVNDGPDQSQLASANASLMSAQANMDTLLEGASTTELRQAQINLETAQMALSIVQEQRDDATLVAPFDGIVASVDVAVGEMPTSTGAITLINTGGYTITLSVDEKDIAQLAVGQQVNVSVSAMNATVDGAVTEIGLAPASTSDLVTYSVEVTLDPTEAQIRPGMSAVANVVLNEVDNVILVPNRFITTDAAGQSTVKVQSAPETYTDVPVTLGATTDSESVITSGVSIGQTLVILSSGTSSTTTTQQGAGLGILGGGLAGGGGAPPGGGNFGGGGGNFNGGGARP